MSEFTMKCSCDYSFGNSPKIYIFAAKQAHRGAQMLLLSRNREVSCITFSYMLSVQDHWIRSIGLHAHLSLFRIWHLRHDEKISESW